MSKLILNPEYRLYERDGQAFCSKQGRVYEHKGNTVMEYNGRKWLLNEDGTPVLHNGEPVYLVDKLSDLFRTGISELDADLDRFDQALSASIEDRRCVYVIGFEDGVTKVGISKSPERRVATIGKQSGRKVSEYRISDSLPAKEAFEIECLMKQVLSAYALEGEFFNVPFKKAAGLLEHYIEEYKEGTVQ